MARVDVRIDLDRFTAEDWAAVRATARLIGVDPATIDLDTPPVAVLAELIYRSRRREGRRTSAEQALRWALALAEA